jgi:hypothetical protein
MKPSGGFTSSEATGARFSTVVVGGGEAEGAITTTFVVLPVRGGKDESVAQATHGPLFVVPAMHSASVEHEACGDPNLHTPAVTVNVIVNCPAAE